MGFYDLETKERKNLSEKISIQIKESFRNKDQEPILIHFADEDTYIRKTAYLAAGRIYLNEEDLRKTILKFLNGMIDNPDFRVRQTVINTAGEIGKMDFTVIEGLVRKGMTDNHHSVRNAVIGSLKKMGEKNPGPVIKFSEIFILDPDKEIRREICHGLELRGRTHPEEILPLLKQLQHEKVARVRNMLIHVIGQIAYKKNCLEKVIKELHSWENKRILEDAIVEILDVHERYEKFSYYPRAKAAEVIFQLLNQETSQTTCINRKNP